MDDEVLIDRLREFADEIGETPSSTRMDKEGPHTAKTYQNHFGTWNDALEQAGLRPNKQRGISDEELLSELNRLYNEKGWTPTGHDMDLRGEYSKSTLIRRFGSWEAALQEAGVDGDRRPKIAKEDLLQELKRIAQKENREPRTVDMKAYGEYSTQVYLERFGSWANAVREAGYEPHIERGLSDEKLLDELRRISRDEDTPPSSPEMREKGKHTRSLYQRRFGSWNAAVQAAGFDPLHRSPGESLEKAIYGEGWTSDKREAVRRRDGFECVVCGIEQSEYKDSTGMSLDVHHIIPARECDTDEERNCMSNLITLCRACHMEYEGSLLPDEYLPEGI